MGTVQVQRDAAVAYVVISNASKRNAMSKAMWEQFVTCMQAMDADETVRVIVIRGEGETSFVSGADISEFKTERDSSASQEAYDRLANKAYAAPGECRKPVIALIRGYCMGGGLGLAAACDIRVCSSDSKFAMPAARLGLGYGRSGVKRFLDLVGVQSTYEIFFQAQPFTADAALRMGFVSAVVADGEIEAYVKNMAEVIAGNAPLTLIALKFSVNSVLSGSAHDAQAAERAIAACRTSGDYREGAKAFLEKRKPVFQGS